MKGKAAPEVATNVVNLMDALRRSVAGAKTSASSSASTPAKAKKTKKRAEGQREMLLPIAGKGSAKEAAKETRKAKDTGAPAQKRAIRR